VEFGVFVGVPDQPMTFGRQAVITQIPEYFKAFQSLEKNQQNSKLVV